MASVLAVSRAGFFYPRSPCGERHLDAWESCDVCGFSIHALLAESDYDTSVLMKCQVKFSIHALLAESDIDGIIDIINNIIFLSTLSLRRATLGRVGVV